MSAALTGVSALAISNNAAIDSDFIAMPPCGSTSQSRLDATGCQPCRDFVAVAVDLRESVVACVRLGNIVAFDSRLPKRDVHQPVGISFVRCGFLPNQI